MALLTINSYEFYIQMSDSGIQWQDITVGSYPATEVHTVDCSSGQVFIGAYSDVTSSGVQWEVVPRDYTFATDINEETHTGTRLSHSYYSAGLQSLAYRIFPGFLGTTDPSTWTFMKRLSPQLHGDGHGIATITTRRVAGTTGNLKIAAFKQRYGGL
jgi:hypothetical protein